MKKILVTFDENGGEYAGTLKISCETFNQITKNTFEVNGAIIEIDEDIIDVEEM